MARNRTLAEIGEELERDRLRNGGARDYNDIKNPLTDNAYLYYMHHRLGWANIYLKEIRNTGYVVILLLMAITAKLYGFT